MRPKAQMQFHSALIFWKILYISEKIAVKYSGKDQVKLNLYLYTFQEYFSSKNQRERNEKFQP